MTVVPFSPRKPAAPSSSGRYKDRIHFDKEDITLGSLLSKHYRRQPPTLWEVIKISSYYPVKRSGLVIYRPGDKRKTLRKVDSPRHLSDFLVLRNNETNETQGVALEYAVKSAIWRLR